MPKCVVVVAFVTVLCAQLGSAVIPDSVAPAAINAASPVVADELAEFEAELASGDVADPFSGYNRAMTQFNDYIYRYLMTPVFDGYSRVVPSDGQKAIGNFFENLVFPVRFVNSLLQFKFSAAGDELLRFVANTIVGFGGISDVATTVYNIPKHKEDFGQTLGFWGVGSGVHIVLPVLGQSNLRDIFGLGADWFLKPMSYSDSGWIQWGAGSVMVINEGASDPYLYERLTAGAVDLYGLLKSSYEQHRNKMIRE